MTTYISPELQQIIESIIAYEKQLEKEKQKEIFEYAYIEESIYEDCPSEREEPPVDRGVIVIDI